MVWRSIQFIELSQSDRGAGGSPRAGGGVLRRDRKALIIVFSLRAPDLPAPGCAEIFSMTLDARSLTSTQEPGY